MREFWYLSWTRMKEATVRFIALLLRAEDRNVELEQQAGDNILFVLNPGPDRNISHSSICVVSEEAFHKAGAPIDRHRVGDCEILCHRD
jgi:hypothetical protein